MPARIDPFVDVLLREGGDQLYPLPDEPVTMLKDGKPRKVSRQPLTDQHIYALLVEVAPSEAADHIDKMAETEFEYIADRGMVRVRIVPELGRLTAVVAPAGNSRAEPVAPAAAAAGAPAPSARRASGATAAPAAAAAQRAPAVAGGPAGASPSASHQPPAGLPMDFAASQYQGAERALGELLKALVTSASSDLHLRVAGPTGSGKSTTLCSLVDLVNRMRTDHIITIEDPIEFVHENKKCVITQRQVGVHTDSFKSALRAALREDPDIVLVGEMRDLETIAIAIETAETGHLVFGTLHTTTAASTVDRIIDQFPADRQSQIRVMLSESLKGVVSQTLCKRIQGGRVAAREILLTTPAISNLIREGKTFQIPSIIQTSKQIGMVTLNDALLELVEKKEISPDEAYVKSVEKTGLVASFKAKGHKLTITA